MISLDDLDNESFISTNPYFDVSTHQYAYNEFVHSLRSNIPPRAINDVECLTPCASSGQDIIHPLTGSLITDNNSSFCATHSHFANGKQRNKSRCFMPNYEVIHNNFVPLRTKDCKTTLQKYSNILDWGSALHWAQLSSEPELQKRQVLNCASRVYNNISRDRKQMYEERQVAYYFRLANRKVKYWFPKQSIMLRSSEIQNILTGYVKEYKLDWLSLHLDSMEVLRRIRNYVAKNIIGM